MSTIDEQLVCSKASILILKKSCQNLSVTMSIRTMKHTPVILQAKK